MQIEDMLSRYPREVKLKNNITAVVRPLQRTDEQSFHEFFCAVPENERLLFKDRVTEIVVIRGWCQNLDYTTTFPLLAFVEGKVAADCTLHQKLGGWKRHIGQVRVVVHPKFRGLGLARWMVREQIEVGRSIGLEKLEAEFLGEQQSARQVFGVCGFGELLLMKDYVKDMNAISHDYVLMGRNLITDEEYAGAN